MYFLCNFNSINITGLRKIKLYNYIRRKENILMRVLNLEDLRHGIRVANLSLELAQNINFPENKFEYLYLSGLFHDIGKSYLDQQILNKPGALTYEEREHIKQHPLFSYAEVLNMGYPEEIAMNILHHHECWNGSGYPKGLKKNTIPLVSRIIKITDIFDALTMERPYRKGLTVEQSLNIMAQEISTFDPRIYEAFHKLISSNYKDKPYRSKLIIDELLKTRISNFKIGG